jgi:hypothetical protein
MAISNVISYISAFCTPDTVRVRATAAVRPHLLRAPGPTRAATKHRLAYGYAAREGLAHAPTSRAHAPRKYQPLPSASVWRLSVLCRGDLAPRRLPPAAHFP